jgi:hypothetical protein
MQRLEVSGAVRHIYIYIYIYIYISLGGKGLRALKVSVTALNYDISIPIHKTLMNSKVHFFVCLVPRRKYTRSSEGVTLLVQ